MTMSMTRRMRRRASGFGRPRAASSSNVVLFDTRYNRGSVRHGAACYAVVVVVVVVDVVDVVVGEL
jgi:hypothetical protein